MNEYGNETPLQPPLTPEGPDTKRCFNRVGWAYCLILGVWTGLQILLARLGDKYAPQLLESSWGIWLLSLLPLYLAAVPLGYLVLRRLPAQRPAVGKKLSAERLFELFTMCFALMYLGNLIGTLCNYTLAAAKGLPFENPIGEVLQNSSILANLVCVVGIAPVMEELIFRKLLCDRVRVCGEGTAVLTSGLVFGLFHGNLGQFFYAFLAGMLFADIYLRTGRIRYSMLLHACINFFGGVLPIILLKNVDIEKISDLSTDLPRLMSYAQNHLGAMLGFGIYGLTVLALFILGIIFLISDRKKAAVRPAKLRAEGVPFGASFGRPGMLVYLLLSVGLMVFTAIKT